MAILWRMWTDKFRAVALFDSNLSPLELLLESLFKLSPLDSRTFLLTLLLCIILTRYYRRLTGMTGTFSPAVLQQIGGSSTSAASGTRAATATGTASVATALTASAAPSALTRSTSLSVSGTSTAAFNGTATALPRSAGERLKKEGALALVAMGMALYIL